MRFINCCILLFVYVESNFLELGLYLLEEGDSMSRWS